MVTVNAPVIFPRFIFQRRIIKACLINDNKKQRGIRDDEEFESDTDRKVETIQ